MRQLSRSLESSLGKVIQARRKELGFSQEELGFRSGLHRTFVSQLERGLKSPSLRTLVTLSDSLEIAPDVIVRQAVADHERGRTRK